jgi:hypothetical protein
MARLPQAVGTPREVGVNLANPVLRTTDRGADPTIQSRKEGYEAIGNLGETAFNIGTIKWEQDLEAADHEANIRYQQFQHDMAQRQKIAVRGASGNSAGMTASFAQDYDANARAFLETVPGPLKAKYDKALFATYNTRVNSLQNSELAINDAHQKKRIAEGIDIARKRMAEEPEMAESIMAETVAMIDSSNLPPLAKQQLSEEYLKSGRIEALTHRYQQDRSMMESMPLDGQPKLIADMIAEEAAKYGINDPAGILAIVNQESSFNPNAVPLKEDGTPASSARGLFQMLSATRKEAGLGDHFSVEQEIQAGVKHYAKMYKRARTALGREPQPHELYALHMQGAAGGSAILRNPKGSFKQTLNSTGGAGHYDKVIKANPYLADIETNEQFLAWAAEKMGSSHIDADGNFIAPPKLTSDPLYQSMSYDEQNAFRETLAEQHADYLKDQQDAYDVEQQVLKEQREARLDELRMAAEEGQLSRDQLHQIWHSDQRDLVFKGFEDFSKVRTIIDRVSNESAGSARTLSGIVDLGGVKLNPTSGDDRKTANTIFSQLLQSAQGDEEQMRAAPVNALQRTYDLTGIIPPDSITMLRGSMFSGDIESQQMAFKVAAAIVGGDPLAFAHAKNGKSLADDAAHFTRLTERQGFTDEAAIRHIMKIKEPGYQAPTLPKSKIDDLAGKLKFDDVIPSVGWFGEASTDAWDLGRKSALEGDMLEIAKSVYGENGGDVIDAVEAAKRIVETNYGVNPINGQFSKYPVNRFHEVGPDGTHSYIFDQASKAIKDLDGREVSHENIFFLPLPGISHAAAENGRSVPYQIRYKDEDGVLHTIYDKAFIAEVPYSEYPTLDEYINEEQSKKDEPVGGFLDVVGNLKKNQNEFMERVEARKRKRKAKSINAPILGGDGGIDELSDYVSGINNATS